MTMDDFGVVAIGRNEGERLVRCLTSVKTETRNHIVYVDSGSTDSSPKTASEIGVRVVTLDLTQTFHCGACTE